MDLEVALDPGLTVPAGTAAQFVEAFVEACDRVRERGGDGGEVLLVAADECRVGLGGEAFGKVEGGGADRSRGRVGIADQRGVHGMGSWRHRDAESDGVSQMRGAGERRDRPVCALGGPLPQGPHPRISW